MDNKFILILIFLSINVFSFGQSDSVRTNELFKSFLAKADSLFIKKDLGQAAQYYGQASNLKRNEAYPKNMQTESLNYIADADKQKSKCAFFMGEGTKCLLNQDTLCARENFLKAFVLMDNCSTRNLLSFVDKKIKCCPDDTYECAIRKGEYQFKCNRYKDAIISFKEALTIQNKQYPKDMIKKCEEFEKQKK
jgi:hypothetical protein